MVDSDRARKLLVRSALVTGSTIATLVGAQNLAMIDMRQFELTNTQTATPEAIVVVPLQVVATSLPALTETEQPTVEVTIARSAPSITILRQSGDVNTLSSNSTSNTESTGQVVIQPPVASLMATQPPVVVQSQSETVYVTIPQPAVANQPVQQSTGSSR